MRVTKKYPTRVVHKYSLKAIKQQHKRARARVVLRAMVETASVLRRSLDVERSSNAPFESLNHDVSSDARQPSNFATTLKDVQEWLAVDVPTYPREEQYETTQKVAEMSLKLAIELLEQRNEFLANRDLLLDEFKMRIDKLQDLCATLLHATLHD